MGTLFSDLLLALTKILLNSLLLLPQLVQLGAYFEVLLYIPPGRLETQSVFDSFGHSLKLLSFLFGAACFFSTPSGAKTSSTLSVRRCFTFPAAHSWDTAIHAEPFARRTTDLCVHARGLGLTTMVQDFRTRISFAHLESRFAMSALWRRGWLQGKGKHEAVLPMPFNLLGVLRAGLSPLRSVGWYPPRTKLSPVPLLMPSFWGRWR